MPQKASRSGVTLGIAGLPMMVTTDLMPAKQSVAKTGPKFKTICPEHDEPTTTKQRYICEEHGQFTVGQLDKALELEDGSLRRVTPEEIQQIKDGDEPLPENNLELHVYPAADVAAVTMQSGATWRLKVPKKKDAELPYYALIRDLIADESKAYVGEVNLGSKLGTKMVQVRVRQGQMFLHEMIRPGEIAEQEDYGDVDYDSRLIERARQLMDGAVEEFNPEQYESQALARAEVIAATEAGEKAEMPEPTVAKPSGEDAMLAMLDSAIEAQEAA